MSKTNNTINIDYLRLILNYDKDSGVINWSNDAHKTVANKIAGFITNHGYRHIQIEGKTYKSHRLAWAIYYGKWPDGDIDHINHDRLDNRIKNLRCVNNGINQKNASLSRKNTTGVTGVYWYKKLNKWQSSIMSNRKHIHIGYFDDFLDACCARKSAELKHGFHDNHGRA